MSCTCGGGALMVPEGIAEAIVSQATPEERRAIRAAAFAWLVTRHEGVEHYLGIRGRPYSDDERDTIAQDSGAVGGTLCPFLIEGECVLPGGLDRYLAQAGAQHTPSGWTSGPPYLWLATALARILDREMLVRMVDTRQIADAKILTGTRTWPMIYRTPSGGFIAG